MNGVGCRRLGRVAVVRHFRADRLRADGNGRRPVVIARPAGCRLRCRLRRGRGLGFRLRRGRGRRQQNVGVHVGAEPFPLCAAVAAGQAPVAVGHAAGAVPASGKGFEIKIVVGAAGAAGLLQNRVEGIRGLHRYGGRQRAVVAHIRLVPCRAVGKGDPLGVHGHRHGPGGIQTDDPAVSENGASGHIQAGYRDGVHGGQHLVALVLADHAQIDGAQFSAGEIDHAHLQQASARLHVAGDLVFADKDRTGRAEQILLGRGQHLIALIVCHSYTRYFII